MKTIDSDNESTIVIKTNQADSFSFTKLDANIEIELFSSDKYMSLDCNNLDKATLSYNNGISLEGNNYSFTSFISTNGDVSENENGLASISASGTSNVDISVINKDVKIESENDLSNISTNIYIGNKTKGQNYSNNYSKFTVNVDSDTNIELGDINHDGKVDIIDATELQRHLVGTNIIINIDKSYADINDDDVINIKDVTQIQKKLVFIN